MLAIHFIKCLISIWWPDHTHLLFPFICWHNMGPPGGSDDKESACNSGDLGSLLRSGRSPGEGNGYPLHYSCLENSMDRGAWQGTVHGVEKSWTLLSKIMLREFLDLELILHSWHKFKLVIVFVHCRIPFAKTLFSFFCVYDHNWDWSLVALFLVCFPGFIK